MLLSLLQYHRQRLRPLQLDDEATRTLARLVEARRKAVDRRTLLLNQLVSTLKNYFPQALELVGEDLCTAMALDSLAKWPRLIDAQAAKPATLKIFLSPPQCPSPSAHSKAFGSGSLCPVTDARLGRYRSERPHRTPARGGTAGLG